MVSRTTSITNFWVDPRRSFYQDYPPQLVDLQAKYWDPLLEWSRKNFGVELNKSESILFNTQPAATKEKLGQVLAEFDAWEMAGMYPVTAPRCPGGSFDVSYGTSDIHHKIIHNCIGLGQRPFDGRTGIISCLGRSVESD